MRSASSGSLPDLEGVGCVLLGSEGWREGRDEGDERPFTNGDIDDDEKSILRNCLVTEQGQVIWIDFDQSHIPGSPSISSYIGTTKRVDFWLEIASCWRKFYSAMVGPFFEP